jgi:AraC-like DNA-binding protein
VNRVLLFSWEFLSPAYIIYSLFILIKHQKHVKRYFSNVIGKNIRWLLVLVSGFILNMMLFYSVWLLVDVFHYNIDVYTFQFIPVAFLTVYIFFLGLFGYRQSGIFFNSEGTLLRNSSGKKKYNKSGLSEGERTELISRLNEIMLLEKPYLENDLNISNLAGMIDTDFHKLSQVINESFSKNFYDYINTYRIEESKRLLRKPDSEKFKIISIAYDSGFSTKSSFYNAFRKNTGLTPGEYVKKFRSQSSKAILN